MLNAAMLEELFRFWRDTVKYALSFHSGVIGRGINVILCMLAFPAGASCALLWWMKRRELHRAMRATPVLGVFTFLICLMGWEGVKGTVWAELVLMIASAGIFWIVGCAVFYPLFDRHNM